MLFATHFAWPPVLLFFPCLDSLVIKWRYVAYDVGWLAGRFGCCCCCCFLLLLLLLLRLSPLLVQGVSTDLDRRTPFSRFSIGIDPGGRVHSSSLLWNFDRPQQGAKCAYLPR